MLVYVITKEEGEFLQRSKGGFKIFGLNVALRLKVFLNSHLFICVLAVVKSIICACPKFFQNLQKKVDGCIN